MFVKKQEKIWENLPQAQSVFAETQHPGNPAKELGCPAKNLGCELGRSQLNG